MAEVTRKLRSESADSESIGTEEISLRQSLFKFFDLWPVSAFDDGRAELIGTRHVHRLQRTEPQRR